MLIIKSQIRIYQDLKGGYNLLKFSFVIPAYNVEDYIENTLESLVTQTVNNFEIVIVDDGSSDMTYKRAEEFLRKKQFENYKIIKKKNGGVASARNEGILNADGEYIIFLDGDDYVSNRLVEVLMSKSNASSDIICWGFDIVECDNSVIMYYFDKFPRRNMVLNGVDAIDGILKNEMKICVGSAAFKKKFIVKHKLRYTEGCKNGEDQEFTFKCLSKSEEITFINETMLFYVQRRGSMSNSYNIDRFDSVEAIKRTSTFMKEIEDSKLNAFIKFLDNDAIIRNFFGNLNHCLRYDNSNINSKIILEKIEKKYPNLLSDICMTLRDYKGFDTKIIGAKTFAYYPYFYIKIFRVIEKLKENVFLTYYKK